MEKIYIGHFQGETEWVTRKSFQISFILHIKPLLVSIFKIIGKLDYIYVFALSPIVYTMDVNLSVAAFEF